MTVDTAAARPRRTAMLWSRVSGLGQALRTHFPLTLQGTLTLLVTAGALRVVGYGSMDLVVFALCLCALLIVILALFATVIGGFFIQRRVLEQLALQESHLSTAEFEAGFPNQSGFSLPSFSWLPLVNIHWEILQPSAVHMTVEKRRDTRLHESFTPTRRGKGVCFVRSFEVMDALGLCRYRWTAAQRLSYRILPSTGKLRPLLLRRALIDEDGLPDQSGSPEGDRMEIRPYAPGDSIRDIMWKGYARNRQLNVRLPERSVAFDSRTCAYLVSGDGDEPASGLARFAIEQRLLGEDWLFGADGADSTGATTTSAAALDAIAVSASSQDYGLDAFLRANATAHCLVFVGAEDEAVLARLCATVSNRNTRLNLVVGVDSDSPTAATQKRAWPSESLRARLTDLSQRVESFTLIDRSSGERLGAASLGGGLNEQDK